MLLVNYIVEENAFNGSIGRVVQLCYHEKEGPQIPRNQPRYVMVDIPNLSMPTETVWDVNHPTHVPIPLFMAQCEKKCCSMTTIPLCICKAITTYKSQGQMVGLGHFWPYLVVALASSRGMMTPGLEQVAFSRVTSLDHLALLNNEDHPVTLEHLMKIGQGNGYDHHHEFEAFLCKCEEEMHGPIIEKISSFAPGPHKSFESGYDALVRWYHEQSSY